MQLCEVCVNSNACGIVCLVEDGRTRATNTILRTFSTGISETVVLHVDLCMAVCL